MELVQLLDLDTLENYAEGDIYAEMVDGVFKSDSEAYVLVGNNDQRLSLISRMGVPLQEFMSVEDATELLEDIDPEDLIQDVNNDL